MHANFTTGASEPKINPLHFGNYPDYDADPGSGVHITKNPNFDPISTFSYFHYKKLGDPNFL